jgi:hypothetical protein
MFDLLLFAEFRLFKGVCSSLFENEFWVGYISRFLATLDVDSGELRPGGRNRPRNGPVTSGNITPGRRCPDRPGSYITDTRNIVRIDATVAFSRETHTNDWTR